MFTAPHASAQSPTTQPDRYAAVARFYCEHAAELVRLVAQDLGDRVRAEDGCQAAWTALLSDAQIPLDRRGIAWLRTVARRAGHRAARERECPAGPLTGGGEGEWELAEPCGALRGPLTRVLDDETREEAWRRLRTLTARERRLVGLQALGLSYGEIAALTGDSLRTVERQVLRARRKLRS
jgi:RNA polymerase sigma factor (sigma-70 family)